MQDNLFWLQHVTVKTNPEPNQSIKSSSCSWSRWSWHKTLMEEAELVS